MIPRRITAADMVVVTTMRMATITAVITRTRTTQVVTGITHMQRVMLMKLATVKMADMGMTPRTARTMAMTTTAKTTLMATRPVAPIEGGYGSGTRYD
jgi:hypothetical protein